MSHRITGEKTNDAPQNLLKYQPVQKKSFNKKSSMEIHLYFPFIAQCDTFLTILCVYLTELCRY